MLLELLALWGIFLLGAGHVRKSLPGRSASFSMLQDESFSEYPSVAVIVPLTGNSPGMRLCLESLLDQQYPNYEIIFVTRDQDDPATALLQDLLAHRSRARQVFSGPAQHCGQKNHNLLAGVAAAGTAPEILVFCDSTHLAPPDFLYQLIRPLIQGDADLTTGFHKIVPGDFNLPTLGMVWTVLAIHLLQGIPLLTQPWGGAMAMSRRLFEAQAVGRRWAETVVDDISLVPQLRRAGIKVKPVAAATLVTPLAGQSWGDWINWLTRQLLYVKFCLPGTWLGASLAAYLLVGPILLAGAIILAGVGGLVNFSWLLIAVGFLAGLGMMGSYFRQLISSPIPWRSWIMALFAVLFVASWCYGKTWRTNIIAWRGISYRVVWGGKVKEIIYHP